MRVLILQHKIQQYRVPIFRLLASRVRLTLATDDISQIKLMNEECFDVLHLPVYSFGPVMFHHPRLITSLSKFDVVIALQNLRCIDLMLLSLIPVRNFKYVLWGIGVSASYTKKYDEDKRLDFLRKLFFARADALIFYTSYPKAKYLSYGFESDKLFVAQNTTEVLINRPSKDASKRKSFLFIGSLYAQKGLEKLIEIVYELNKGLLLKDYVLDIVGDGIEKESLESLVKELNIEEKVIFHGAIYEEEKIAKFFNRAALCLSPEQAGLSVLKSMGYGVCMVTKSDAITGGERLHITNRQTGILFNDFSELKEILVHCVNDPKTYIDIGEKARDYYYRYTTPQIMSQGILSAINYVTDGAK